MVLPAPVPHAVVLDAGRAGDLTWMALEQIPGQRLDLAWPRLPASPRREAVISGVVVHGDAHLANVLWHDGRLAALLDFEWARIGPPDLELEAACRTIRLSRPRPGMKRAPRVTCRCSPGCEPATPASSSTRT
jgi:Phosphotransferase enzyme family